MANMSQGMYSGLDGETLPFIVRLDGEQDGDTMGLFRRDDGEVGVRSVSASVLRENISRTMATLHKVFEDLGAQFGPLGLDEVQVGLEISASGGVHLLGTAGVKAAITLVFRDHREGKD
jgi:hypothetical protein